jgi:hypothetical protein
MKSIPILSVPRFVLLVAFLAIVSCSGKSTKDGKNGAEKESFEFESDTIKPLGFWKGRIGEAARQKFPTRTICTSQDDFSRMWQACGIEAPMPKVDFTKELIVYDDVQRSEAGMRLEIEAGGELVLYRKEGAERTNDWGFTIAHIKRDGIKTYSGFPIK